MRETMTTLTPSRHDFPEDWTPQAIEHGLYDNTCRECGANIRGHKYRRTCRVCVEIFKKQSDANRTEA